MRQRQKWRGEQSALLTVLSARRVGSEEYEHEQDCPACGNVGWLICSIERGPLEWDYDGHDGYPLVTRTAYPNAFYCLVCNLALDNQDELTHLGLPDQIELEP